MEARQKFEVFENCNCHVTANRNITMRTFGPQTNLQNPLIHIFLATKYIMQSFTSGNY